MKNKKQHWIPRSYLSAWSDPAIAEGVEPYVWLFPKECGEGRKKAPKNIFYESDMYTIKRADGVRDLRLEHGLAGLESDFVALRRDKLASRIELSSEDKLIACAFVAAAQARTQKQRDHFQSVWSGVLDHMNAIRDSMRKRSPKERDEIARLTAPASRSEASLGYDDVERLAGAPLQHMLESIVSTQIPLLYEMDIAILSTADSTGFITSDAPCVWFDPEAYSRPYLYQAPGLTWPTIEVTLPISPSQLILINRQGMQGYQSIPSDVLDDINRRTRGYADRFFIVRENKTRPIWYEMGTPKSN